MASMARPREGFGVGGGDEDEEEEEAVEEEVHDDDADIADADDGIADDDGRRCRCRRRSTQYGNARAGAPIRWRQHWWCAATTLEVVVTPLARGTSGAKEPDIVFLFCSSIETKERRESKRKK